MNDTTEITRPTIILVEGRDECRFLPVLATERQLPEVQFLDYGGKKNLSAYLRTLPLIPGYTQVTGIGVIRDADSSHADALKSVREGMRRAGLPTPAGELQVVNGPPRAAIFIAPGNGNPGELEDCLLACIGTRPELGCIEDLITCVEGSMQVQLAQRNKSKIWTFLAVQQEPMHHVGVGARAGLWPMNHQALDGYARLIELVST